MLSRRRLLASSAALGAAALTPRPARASVSPEDLKFVFVVVFRGWDTTRVYAPEFDNPVVVMEDDADRATYGGLELVDHEERPAVRAFFEAWHSRCLLLNGITVPSLSHSECLRLMMSGTNAASGADWPARIAARSTGRYALPHVVVEGPNYPGDHGGIVTRIGSTAWIEEILDGRLLDRADSAPRQFSAAGSSRMDAAVAGFASARRTRATTARECALADAYASSLTRLDTLKRDAGELTWPSDTRLASQAALAADLLGQGLSRCVTLAHDHVDWDSHADNDARQSYMFDDLYDGLGEMMARFSATPGTHAETLADETVVVVLSEMGRTPNKNGGAGKDHWPHTSMLVCGPNVTGDRVIGGYDALFAGQRVDLASGESDEDGDVISPRVVGATLLALAGIDPREELDAGDPIEGALA